MRTFLIHCSIIALISATLLPSVVTPADESPTEWLLRINKAAAEQNFLGSFIYSRDDSIEAIEVARRITDGMAHERLYALTGEPREIVRDLSRVLCVLPEQKIKVLEHRQVLESGFPRLDYDDIKSLEKLYAFRLGDTMRIADRDTQQIVIIPKDEYRYGFHLWADTETGLLLRSDVLDDDARVLEKYLFVNIEIGGDFDERHFHPTERDDQMQLFRRREFAPTSTERSDWHMDKLPAGYKLIRHIRRISAVEANEIEHMVFTDGLSTVSVFIKAIMQGQSNSQGLSRMGAVNVFRRSVANHRITVMGEAPADTVAVLAQNIAHRPQH